MTSDTPAPQVAPAQDTEYAAQLIKLHDLRGHLGTLAVAQQTYYDRDGHMDNWATKMHLLQFNIAQLLIAMEKMSGGPVADITPDEQDWVKNIQDDEKRS